MTLYTSLADLPDACPDGLGCVYVLLAEDGRVKIGKTVSPKARAIANGKTAGVRFTSAYLTEPCCNFSEIELQVHGLFEERRIAGEWFWAAFDEVCEALELLKGELKTSPAAPSAKGIDFRAESGKRLRVARTARRLSLEALAGRLQDVTPSRLGNYENGLRLMPPGVAHQLAATLGVTAAWLLCLEPEDAPSRAIDNDPDAARIALLWANLSEDQRKAIEALLISMQPQ